MRLRIAEVLLAFIFVAGGLSTLRNPGLRAEQIARFRFPFADLSVRVNAVFMVIAGVALALNFHASIASASLAALLVPTTIFGHAFWLERGAARQAQMAHFFKNLGLLGGLLLVTVIAE